jgi:hypothetical protein
MLRLDGRWSRMEAIAIELGFRDAPAPSSTIGTIFLILSVVVCSCCVLDLRKPLKLASWKEQDIVKSRIKGMQISDALKSRAISAVENDVSDPLWLVTIAGKNDSDLIGGSGRKVVAATVAALIEAKSNLALLLWRHVPGELMGLLVHLDSGMVTVEHVLKGDHGVMIELGVPPVGHPKVDSISWIIDVQLSVDRRFPLGWKKGSTLVGKLAMHPEDVGTFTVIDRLVHLATDGSHGKGIVVGADVFPEVFCNWILSGKELHKLRWRLMKRGQGDLSTETACAELGTNIRGSCETFSHPMQSMAAWTLNVHSSKEVDRPVMVEGLACRRQMQVGCWWGWWWWW